MRSSLLLLVAATLLSGCALLRHPAPPPPVLDLYARTFTAESPRDVQTLVVALHGGEAGDAEDSYAVAQTLADTIPDSAVVTLLRPGFSDAAGNRSPGQRGTMTGSALTTETIRAVSRDVVRLKGYYPHARVVLFGQGTSAALAADIAGTQGGVADGMVLVSCPCTLPEWRKYMAKQRPDEPFDTPVPSLDPLQTAGGLSPALKAAILVGAGDDITPPRFSRTYAEAIALRGIATDYRVLPDKGHDILADPEVISATERLAAALPEKAE